MEIILSELQQLYNWKELMRSSCRVNGLNTSLAGDLTILKLRQLDERFKKSSLNLGEKASSWSQNELRAFNWLLVAVSALSSTLIRDFADQWETLRQVFLGKDLNFLKFEARKLLEAKGSKNKNWSKQEEELLMRQAVKFQSDKISWNEVAHRMFESSHQATFRSGKHCREHWLNYLDPEKQRGAWSVQEDLVLLERVAATGKKWSEYAVSLKRTEHTVKNRYNSLVIKQRKLTPHIKKEEKLVKQLQLRLQEKKMAMLRANQAKCQRQSSQKEQSPSQQEQIHPNECVQECSQANNIQENVKSEAANSSSSNQALMKIVQQQPQLSEQLMNEVIRQEEVKGEREEAGEKIQVENPLSNYSPVLIPNCDLNFFIKEDNKDMNKTVFSEFPIYSPYSPYIISPNTPSNYLPSAPVFVSSQFYNYYNAFMNLTELTKQENRDSNAPN